MNNKVIMIEGSRGVGKTFLVKSLNMDANIHKIPFAGYFNECFVNDFPDLTKEEANKKTDIHYYSLAYDIIVLDLVKTNKINYDLIVDRSLLSSFVFGILANRVTFDQIKNEYDWIKKTYGQHIEIIYVNGNTGDDTRNKDMWNIYNNKETHDMYQRIIKELEIPVTYFNNNYDEKSVDGFNVLIRSKMNDLPR
jgi:hypothetical protein